MATNRRTRKGAAGKRTASRGTATRTAGAKRGSTPRRPRKAPSAGAREARAVAAAREVEAASRPGPALRVAEPPTEETSWAIRGDGDAAIRRDMAEVAHAVEQAAGEAEEELRSRVHAASVELGRRRDHAEAEGRRVEGEAESELGGASAIAVELAIGALRLVRTIATAPLRIGLAFLRARDP